VENEVARFYIRYSLQCMYTVEDGTVTVTWRDCLYASGTAAAVAVCHFHLCSTVPCSTFQAAIFHPLHTGAICCHPCIFSILDSSRQRRETATTELLSRHKMCGAVYSGDLSDEAGPMRHLISGRHLCLLPVILFHKRM